MKKGGRILHITSIHGERVVSKNYIRRTLSTSQASYSPRQIDGVTYVLTGPD